jgi:hypothetical protein
MQAALLQVLGVRLALLWGQLFLDQLGHKLQDLFPRLVGLLMAWTRLPNLA